MNSLHKGIIIATLAALVGCGGVVEGKGAGAPPEFLAGLKHFPPSSKFILVSGDVQTMKDIKGTSFNWKSLAEERINGKYVRYFKVEELGRVWLYMDQTNGKMMAVITGAFDKDAVIKRMTEVGGRMSKYDGTPVVVTVNRDKKWAFCKDHIYLGANVKEHIENEAKGTEGLDPTQEPLKSLLEWAEPADTITVLKGQGAFRGADHSVIMARVAADKTLGGKVVSFFETVKKAEEFYGKAAEDMRKKGMPGGGKITHIGVNGRVLIMTFEGMIGRE